MGDFSPSEDPSGEGRHLPVHGLKPDCKPNWLGCYVGEVDAKKCGLCCDYEFWTSGIPAATFVWRLAVTKHVHQRKSTTRLSLLAEQKPARELVHQDVRIGIARCCRAAYHQFLAKSAFHWATGKTHTEQNPLTPPERKSNHHHGQTRSVRYRRDSGQL